MKKAPPKPKVLIIASEETERSALAAGLEGLAQVQAVAPSALQHPAPLLDAVAAVATLEGSTPQSLEGLSPLRELPAGRSLVLVVRDTEEGQLEEAISRLDPVSVLSHPVPLPSLRLAIRQALPEDRPGEGARVNHRRARVLLGVSASIRDILDQIRQVADSRLPILILGETGTGKELVARAIHEQSPRAEGPFVAVNCGALPDTLLESELFGFERGAFTGADRSKTGLFEQASGGTLFLDEIGDTSPALQAKLLRAIEEQEIRLVGGTETISVNVRIVSATHRDLEGAVEQESFRQDLFYRLNTVTIHLPPLRRRRVDIPFLAQHFAEEFGEANARRITLGEDFLEALSHREFPGNVRELRNAVERAIALARPGETVSAKQLEGLDRSGTLPRLPPSGTLRERIEQVEHELIREALERLDGNRTRVAQALGLSRVGLRQKMRRLGLDGTSQR